MPDLPQNTQPVSDYSIDVNTRLRDVEDRIRLLKDRVILVGKSLIDSRDKTFSETQEMKKTIIKLTDENARLKEMVQRLAEQMDNAARKEDLLIIQRQLDLLRK